MLKNSEQCWTMLNNGKNAEQYVKILSCVLKARFSKRAKRLTEKAVPRAAMGYAGSWKYQETWPVILEDY